MWSYSLSGHNSILYPATILFFIRSQSLPGSFQFLLLYHCIGGCAALCVDGYVWATPAMVKVYYCDKTRLMAQNKGDWPSLHQLVPFLFEKWIESI